MDFSKLMFWKHNHVDEKHSQNVSEAGTSGQISNANLKNFLIKAVGFAGEDAGSDFEDPSYDFDEIKRAVNGDSYIKIATSKYSQLIFKAGYSIVSENDAAAEYIRGRLRMMSFMTKVPVDILFQQTAEDLVSFSNAYWFKSRQKMTNIGGLTAKGVLNTDPVCGYYRVDPSTVTIKRDKNGTIKQYNQKAGNNEKTFKPEDVVHFYIDKAGGDAYGTPRIIAVMEDVKLLRKLEGNVLTLSYRYAMPIYQVKIGLPEAGFMATEKEIKEARSEVEKMANDGILVTNERTDFKSIGAEGQALDLNPYLNYFEKRVFTGLNAPESWMGRGGAKQDADSMEEQVHDTVKFIQHTMSVMIREFVFNELLLEGGYNPIMNEQDIVDFQFNEINNETRVKMETHALNQFQGNTITFEEMRKRVGLRADNVDESRLYANMIQQPNAVQLVQAKLGAGGGATATTGTGNEKAAGGKKDNSGTVKSTMTPQNQNGKTSAHIKEMTESTSNTHSNEKKYEKNFSKVYKRFSVVRNEVCENGENKPDARLAIARDGIIGELTDYITESARNGINKSIKDSDTKIYPLKKISMTPLTDNVRKVTTGIFKDIAKKLKHANTYQEREAVFDSVEYRLRFLTDHIVSKAYWYAYAVSCRELGIEKLYVNFGKSSDKEEHESIIDLKKFSIDDIPPFHAYCSCKISANHKDGE